MTALGSPVLIDGSHGEGGGTLVRTCLVMSCLTQQALRLTRVRGGTKFPGLDFEDLVLLRALAKSCSAEVTGAEVGAETFSFLPTRRPRGLNQNLDLPEGGSDRNSSVPVVLSALIPVLATTGTYSQISLSGETYGNNTLSFDYFNRVTIPALLKLGIYSQADQETAGFGRDGKGHVTLEIEPSAIQPLDWSSRGRLVNCHAVITTAEMSGAVGQRAISHLKKLAENAKVPIDVEVNPVDSRSAGAFVTVWAVTERGMGGCSAMGRRGLRVEHLAQSAFEGVLGWLATDATVDSFLADQILVAACLADGESKFRVDRLTKRFLTSVWVIKQFLPIHVTVHGVEDGPGVVTIKR
jgi:RNA 3'-terminal phosphate cyclase (ATP)